MAFYFDTFTPNLKEGLSGLPPTPGYCIFVDIVGSTALKDGPITEWAAFIHNTFINATCFLGRQMVPLKTIGDCCMFYIPEAKLAEMGEHALSLFTSLCRLAAEPDPVYKEVKIGAAFCRHAFELTFVENAHDIYGKDIDLTSRLLGFAGPREIVMNAGFVERVQEIYSRLSGKEECPEVEKIFGPWPQAIKGFKEQIAIFKVPAPHWA